MLPFVQEPQSGRANFDAWVYHHFEDHQEIIDGVRRLLGVILPVYPINIYAPHAAQEWKYNHQQLHQDMGSVLGITISDLETVNFENLGESRDWFYLNLSDHEAAHRVLGI